MIKDLVKKQLTCDYCGFSETRECVQHDDQERAYSVCAWECYQPAMSFGSYIFGLCRRCRNNTSKADRARMLVIHHIAARYSPIKRIDLYEDITSLSPEEINLALSDLIGAGELSIDMSRGTLVATHRMEVHLRTRSVIRMKPVQKTVPL